jgi:hypothetical protein
LDARSCIEGPWLGYDSKEKFGRRYHFFLGPCFHRIEAFERRLEASSGLVTLYCHFHHWLLGRTYVLHLERTCIAHFLLHRLQHTPGQHTHGKEEGRKKCSPLFLFYFQEAAFCRHIISPRLLLFREDAGCATGERVSLLLPWSYIGSMYKSGRLFRFLFSRSSLNLVT